MTLIDKIIQEWSYRTNKGYPDINNQEDMALFEAMFEVKLTDKVKEETQQTNQSVQDLIKLLNSKEQELSPEQNAKLYSIIKKTGKGYTTSLINALTKKGLGEEQALLIAGYADKNNIENNIISSLNNSNNTYDKLSKSGNLSSELANITGIDSKHINKLISFSPGSDQKGVGRGEMALICLLSDTKKAAKGDVVTANGKVELKASSLNKKGTLTGAILAPKKISGRGDSIGEIVSNILKFFPEEDAKVLIPLKNAGWTGRLFHYLNVLKQTSDKNKENQFYINLKKLLDDIYGPGVVKVETADLNSLSQFNLRIAKDLAKAYIEEIAHPIMFISSDLDYKIISNSQDLEQEIGNSIKIVTTVSDYTPRLALIK